MNHIETQESVLEQPLDLAYRALAQTGCGALIADAEGTIVYVNSRLCEISGYSPDELIGSNPKILQSGTTSRETYLTLWNTISSGRPWHGILQNKKKSGEIYWEAITISSIRNNKGEITHFSGIMEDVTDEKLIESAQAQVDEEIFQEEKRECLSAMALGMAHDMKNSLFCVMAACDLARMDADKPERIKEMLEYIKNAAKRGATFMDHVVSLCKPSMPASVMIELAKVVEDHVEQYRGNKKCLIRWLPNTSSTPIIGNAPLIHQAVLALVNNASESNSKQPIEISCGTLDKLEPAAEEFFIPCGLNGLSVSYLEVADHGEGMDTYVLRRACNPFYSTKDGQKGLGLSSVYGIMTAHKGAIGFVSSPGKGTRVRLYFRSYARKSSKSMEAPGYREEITMDSRNS